MWHFKHDWEKSRSMLSLHLSKYGETMCWFVSPLRMQCGIMYFVSLKFHLVMDSTLWLNYCKVWKGSMYKGVKEIINSVCLPTYGFYHHPSVALNEATFCCHYNDACGNELFKVPRPF